jgi:hypothetical protein
MPTRKQLYKIWNVQFKYFGGFGQPKQAYEGSSEGNGMTSDKFTDTPLVPKITIAEFTGEEIGSIQLNEKTKDLQIVIDEQRTEADK